jgi:thymidylate synthase
MPIPIVTAATIDDVMREAVEAVLAHGHAVGSSAEGPNTELLGVTLQLTNPRARLSRTEARGKPFSCLGELCWYLSGSNATAQIIYYVSRYGRYDENGRIFGGYGPRLLSSQGANQLQNVIRLLREKPASRQAVIQLFSARDLAADSVPPPPGKKRDIPCTCTFQFFVRDEQLHMMTYMRSNDAWFGLTHDLFCFTMLQEIIARSVECELGTYTHFAGSLHVYDKHRPLAEKLSDEGWQSTKHMMPPMPTGNPFPSIARLLLAEQAIRTGDSVSEEMLHGLDVYWTDLIRLLQAYRHRKDSDAPAIERLRPQMHSDVYDMYLQNAAQSAASKTA